MKKEKCCGCIIIKNNNVLVVQEKEGHWGLPKGHVEGNETEVETAIREVKEETNLDVKVDSSKKYSVNYIIDNEIDKTVYFFPAKVIGGELKNQESEIANIKWLSSKDAIEIMTYDDVREMLTNALIDLNLL